jgi:hypothetical protein
MSCIPKADGSGFDIVMINSNGQTVVDSAGGCSWPQIGVGDVTCVTGADPENPCFQRTTIQVGDNAPCYVEPYNPESCTCVCIDVVAGQTVTVRGTSVDGFSVDWDENNQVTQVAGQANGTAVYQYNTAGEYKLEICLNSACDTLSDWNVTGATAVRYNACN